MNTDSVNRSKNQFFIVGRVTSIVLGSWDPEFTNESDIGRIKFQQLYSATGRRPSSILSQTSNQFAYPMWGFLKHYPIVNEIVLIMVGPSEGLNDNYNSQRLYYFSPYNTWNDSNHNAFPDLQDYANQLNRTANLPGFEGSDVLGSLYLGYTFKEKYVRNLQPFEGDIIMQSRYGQSIRFGSTNKALKSSNTWSQKGETGDPITIITNEQGERSTGKFETLVEDINKDGSSIYLTSTQEIRLEDVNNFPLRSFKVNLDVITQNVVEASSGIPISNYGIAASLQDTIAIAPNSANKSSFEETDNT
jgi:hypothetical protein